MDINTELNLPFVADCLPRAEACLESPRGRHLVQAIDDFLHKASPDPLDSLDYLTGLLRQELRPSIKSFYQADGADLNALRTPAELDLLDLKLATGLHALAMALEDLQAQAPGHKAAAQWVQACALLDLKLE